MTGRPSCVPPPRSRTRARVRSSAIAIVSTVVVFGRARLGRRQRPRLAGGPGSRSSTAEVFWSSPAGHRRRVLDEHPAVHGRRGPGPPVRARSSRSCAACRARSSSRSGIWRPSTSTSSGRCRASSSSTSSGSASRGSGSGDPQTTRFFWAIIALTLDLLGLRLGGLPRRHRLDPSQPGRGGALARPVAAAGAPLSSSCRRPIRRVIPPLLNDFIGLQKDTVLVSFIGVVEIFRRPRSSSRRRSTSRRTSAVALVFIVVPSRSPG